MEQRAASLEGGRAAAAECKVEVGRSGRTLHCAVLQIVPVAIVFTYSFSLVCTRRHKGETTPATRCPSPVVGAVALP